METNPYKPVKNLKNVTGHAGAEIVIVPFSLW